jgi:hypothetical protein
VFLVVCDIEDAVALWFASKLRAAGVPTLVATSDVLSFARRRSQRVSARGVESVVELADGAAIARPAFVLIRLMAPPAAAWRWATAGERNYAIAELNAFVLGWLAGLDCPVRNRPDPSCLAGPAPHPLVLAAAATRAGLDCADVTFVRGVRSPADYLLESAARASGPGARPCHGVCLDGEILNLAVPPHVARRVRDFTTAVGADAALVGIDFLVQDDKWWFAGMSPIADLRAGGGPLRDRLVSLAMEPAP